MNIRTCFLLSISGEAIGLIHPNSNTKVAVKTTSDALDNSQRVALESEIKILSNLDLHLNLVNMMGSCTTDVHLSGELWLLLEFCEHGMQFSYGFQLHFLTYRILLDIHYF